MTGRARIGIAAAVALLLTSSGLLRLLAPGTWVWPIVLAVLVATASGELFRRLIRPRPLVVLAQAAVVFWYDMVLLAHDEAFGGVLPTWSVFSRLGDLYSTGARDIRETFVGGQATSGIAAILVLSLSALAVLVDALAATYAAAPLAGLPLLALYLVPATRSGGGYDWLAFALAAGGYTALLSAEGRDRLGRWGRPLVHAGRQRTGPDGTPVAAPKARVDTGPIAATGHQITMYALIVAVLAPILLPTVTGGLFGIGPNNGNGNSGGHKKNSSFSQELDLQANLQATADDPVLSYTSAQGQYIRLQTDDLFDANSTVPWKPDTSVGLNPLPADGTVSPTVPGFTLGEKQPATFQIKIQYLTDATTKIPDSPFSSLPLPYPAKQIPGLQQGFSVDPESLAVLGTSRVTNKMTYTATVYDTGSFTSSELSAVTPVTEDDQRQFDLGKDLAAAGVPKDVADKAKEVTQGITNPVAQAQALQDFFQGGNGFSYTVDPKKLPSGKQTGASAMDWLLTNKRGFCQYYAETMAAMARTLGIPARVAVGFTPGQNVSGNNWLVRTHDYHSWPELYFHGIGWLRFEPTVSINNALLSGGHGQVPHYNTVVSTTGTTPSSTPSTSSSPGAAASSSNNCPVNVRKAGDCTNANDNGTADAAPKPKFSWLGWFGAVPRFLQYWLFGGSGYAIAVRFILVALLLIACVPMVLRIARRRARAKLASGRRAGRGAKAGPGPGSDDDDGLTWESADVPAARRPEEDPERLRVLAAWDELRDSATDLGYAWPAAETPRRSAERIIKQAHLSHSVQDAMGRVTGLAERANYARTLRVPTDNGAAPAPNLMEDVKAIRAGLAEPVSRRTRIRATVLPPSALAALRERRDDFTGRVYERVQGAGSRLRSRRPGRGGGRSRPGQ